MACLGFGPADFELFEIDDPSERVAAIDATLQPKLHRIAADCLAGAHPHRREAAAPPRRQGRAAKGQPPEEALVAFASRRAGTAGFRSSASS